MSNTSLSLRPFALLLAGALLVPASAFAQSSAPAITPTDGGVAVPSMPLLAPSASARLPIAAPSSVPASQQIIASLSFRDVDATELLSMISGTFNVPIAVSGDVSSKISYINLSNETPDQAIKLVARLANLQCQKDENGTYIIGKNIVPDAPTQAIVPSHEGLPLLAPSSPSPSMNTGVMPSNDGSRALQPWGPGPMENPVTASGDDNLVPIADSSADETRKNYPIRIRNVPAKMMAYWLDPAHNEMPIQLRQSMDREADYNQRGLQTQTLQGSGTISAVGGVSPASFSRNANSNPYINEDGIETRANAQFGGIGGNNGGNRGGGAFGAGGRGGATGRGGGVFQLPTGVDQIVAIDAQNALLVRGTAAGIAELRDTIAFLDRPLRQVEIEAQFVSISTNDISQFGIDFTTARGNFNANSFGLQPAVSNGGLQVGFVRGNFQAALTAVENAARAKQLSAPRVTAINNLTASLVQSIFTPITLNTTQSVVGGNTAATNTNTTITYIQTSISLQVTPTINNDGTVTVLMQPQFQGTGAPNPTTGASVITSQTLDTVANVRDGETIALGGLKTKSINISGNRVPVISYIPLIGNLFRSRNKTDSEQELIIFLTARILRRVGESDPVAGTG